MSIRSDSAIFQSTALSSVERDQLREAIREASEPIAPFWPMRTMVAQNPIHGLEYLPFDQAVRQGKHLLSGNGYLPNEVYRQFFREGRITHDSVTESLRRAGRISTDRDAVQVGTRRITAQEVWHLHFLFGFGPLQPSLLEWTFNKEGAGKRFHPYLPQKSLARIIEHTVKDCELCRDHPEEAYLTNLWKSTLTALQLSESTSHDHQTNHGKEKDSETRPASLSINLPIHRTLSDWIDDLAGAGLVEQINQQLIKWVTAFLDEGLAGWEMPQREKGFYHAWRHLAQQDHSGKFLGIQDYTPKIQALPEEPEDAIIASVSRLGISTERRKEYLSRMLSQLPGWTRYIRWLGEHPAYHAQRQHPIDTTQYLAVRLFYETELAQMTCKQEWDIEGTVDSLVTYWKEHPDEYRHRAGDGSHTVDPTEQTICRDAWRLFNLLQFLEVSHVDMHELSDSEARTLLHWLDDFPFDQHSPVWLEAYEDSFRADILNKIASHRGTVPVLNSRPQAQLVFCIDVRSESFRRHIEAQGPYETLGFAGFFGIPLSHQTFDSAERAFLCPVLLTPNHAVTEIPRAGETSSLEQYSSGTRWHQLGHHLFHDLKHHPIGSMMTIDVLGVFFSLGLAGKTFLQRTFHTCTSTIGAWFAHRVHTEISVSTPADPRNPRIGEVNKEGIPEGLSQGFSLEERATMIENGLRAMGLTRNYARLVCLCGHGSETDNNPYYGALDCGACGGAPGDANARVFAKMANDPHVRRRLKEHGLPIPDDTWFLPGKHNTTTDRVEFYDLEELPDTHEEDVRSLHHDLQEAGANQALERCHRLPSAPREISPRQAFAHVVERSCDWANTRPEWGLAGNGAFLIGRRTLTNGLDLGGRVFLHSYDPNADPDGTILEKIMTAPLIVGEWINTGYYFSAVDPWVFGSGSKVLHNVVGGVGMMLGSQSDLQMGFPLQTVNNGERHYHEPMRLLAIIEHTPDVISAIIQKHGILQRLFHNQWLNLVSLNPDTFEFSRYQLDASWETMSI
ncbi:MAG: DUF2309 domain-containing protein [Nitrospirales bacterium]|nr:DUF2309 domain-containing protein [Nitrospira sp.]MDR4500650.1 DUF2309 domain-containing protein [Nitrospirales bacterium]